MQAEAGQTLEAIVARKERERRAGGGTFLWGVGNAPAVITNTLARAGLPVRVIFSIMKSRPKSIDSAPARIAAWRSYIDVCGVERRLPPQALVTSRADSASGPKKFHYALMCHSSEPLVLRSDRERFDPSAFRNAGGTGAAVGASQVTALLRRVDRDTSASDYQVNLSAWLTGGYWVRLTDPIELTVAKQALFTRLNDADEAEWVALVAAILEGPQSHLARGGDAVLLI
jgi:limonene-1,2-epoxide hydrolase